MITVTLYAADNSTKILVETPENLVANGSISQYLFENHPIFNYAAFFKQGMNLYDNSLKIGDESGYYGYIGNIEQFEVTPVDTEYISISNGITVVFDRYSCKRIEVYADDVMVASMENENGLPLKTYIPINDEIVGANITLKFSGYPENAYVTIKGLLFGKVLEIDDFFSYNSIAEMRPLGDDLPMNETNFEALLEEDFVDEPNQKVKIYDNSVLYENNFLVSANNPNIKKYSIKSRNQLQLLNSDNKIPYYYFDYVDDWNTISVSASEILEYLDVDVETPEWFETYFVSPFLKPQSTRKILQQLAWATCCGIDTTYSDKIKFVPFLANETTEPDVIINRSDGRIKEIELVKGEKYSKIICEIPAYTKDDEIKELGKVEPYQENEGENRYFFQIDTPFEFYSMGSGNDLVEFRNPYYIEVVSEYGGLRKVEGYGYNKQTIKYIIDIQPYGNALTITNQELYPIDMALKSEQLKKWYSKNNTVKATIVDNNDLRIGKVLKIQLLDGTYFQGIIIKAERSNVGNKHLIDLEAHEWN